jgi:hypothetical protein
MTPLPGPGPRVGGVVMDPLKCPGRVNLKLIPRDVFVFLVHAQERPGLGNEEMPETIVDELGKVSDAAPKAETKMGGSPALTLKVGSPDSLLQKSRIRNEKPANIALCQSFIR